MFLQHTNSAKATEPFHEVPATAGESYVPGEALKLASGKATKCTGAATPAYICQSKIEEATEDDVVLVSLVNPQQELETLLEAEGTALKIGDKVTVGTDGLSVTATTADGVFLITNILGTAAGDKVRGYFMR